MLTLEYLISSFLSSPVPSRAGEIIVLQSIAPGSPLAWALTPRSFGPKRLLLLLPVFCGEDGFSGSARASLSIVQGTNRLGEVRVLCRPELRLDVLLLLGWRGICRPGTVMSCLSCTFDDRAVSFSCVPAANAANRAPRELILLFSGRVDEAGEAVVALRFILIPLDVLREDLGCQVFEFVHADNDTFL